MNDEIQGHRDNKKKNSRPFVKICYMKRWIKSLFFLISFNNRGARVSSGIFFRNILTSFGTPCMFYVLSLTHNNRILRFTI